MSNVFQMDCKANGIHWGGLLKALILPVPFNAVIWIRIFLWLEKHHLPTFLPFRWLYHAHGLEFARRIRIGGGLRIPHPHGILFTEDMKIGERVSIYGNVRFTRSYDKAPRIGNDVFIGDSTVFTGKSGIGNHCIVGAGSVVTKVFGDNVIIAGNPAGIIREYPIEQK